MRVSGVNDDRSATQRSGGGIAAIVGRRYGARRALSLLANTLCRATPFSPLPHDAGIAGGGGQFEPFEPANFLVGIGLNLASFRFMADFFRLFHCLLSVSPPIDFFCPPIA